jgi:16S rRNA (cytidine1402-2'-O)-methyltransferase
VLEGAPERPVALTPDELARLVAVGEQAGLTRKESLAAVAVETGLPKRDVFDAVVAAKASAMSQRAKAH